MNRVYNKFLSGQVLASLASPNTHNSLDSNVILQTIQTSNSNKPRSKYHNPKQLPKIPVHDGPYKLGAIYLTNGAIIIFNRIIDDHPPTTNASSYSHQQITQSFLQVSNSSLLAGKSSIGMQFNFVFVSHGHKNHGKPTLNLQSGEYLDFLFQTLKKTHRN